MISNVSRARARARVEKNKGNDNDCQVGVFQLNTTMSKSRAFHSGGDTKNSAGENESLCLH